MRLSLLLLVALVTTTFAADIRTAKLHLTYTSDEKMNRNVGRLEEVLGSLVPEYVGASSLGHLLGGITVDGTETVTRLNVASASETLQVTGSALTLAATTAGTGVTVTAATGDTGTNGASVRLNAGDAVSVNNGGSILLTAGNAASVAAASGNVALTAGSFGASQSATNTGKVTITGRPVGAIEAPATIPDDGAGTKPTLTVTAYAPIIRLNCADTTGCAITVSTVGASDGQTLLIVGATGSTANNFANSSGLAVSTSPRLVSANDTLSLLFNGSTSKWVEVAYADN